MLKTSIPRLVVSGLRGGSGKTILSLAILASLKTKGLKVVPFKKGPDYIDAGWLAKASGVSCYNLDLFMMSPEQALNSFIVHSSSSEMSLVEGNRGLYDGVDHKGSYSTAELAKLLDAPVVISVDCTKTTSTVAALVLGCQQMDPAVSIGGVVLNRIATARQEALIRKSINERCKLPVLGAIPRLKKDPFPERHMGLTPFQELQGLDESIDAVTEIGSKYLNMDEIMKLAGTASDIGHRTTGDERRKTDDARRMTNDEGRTTHDALRPTDIPRIGVIRDSAFQFYYQENLEELEKRGASIVEVSPLKENKLEDIDALYIGGGFPETHAIALAENISFRQSLYTAIEDGLPVYAECGGLMYLGRSIDLGGRTYPMTGVLPVTFGMEKKPLAHGYTIIEIEKENPFFEPRGVIKGHEFHYSRVLDIKEKNGVSMVFNVKRGRGITDNKDGMCYKNVLASYTHLHAIGTPEWVDGMVKCAMEYRRQGTEGQRERR
jgi:cobyrinic acid a,c-diamide synthase